MLGVGAIGQLALAQFPGAHVVPPTPPKKVVGWGEDRRRIPVEQLRAILKAQGSRWADELGDAVETVEKRAANTPKRRKVIEEVLADVSYKIQEAKPGIDWGAICVSLLALASATRETLARKHAERIALLLADDEEEAIVLLLMDNF